MGSDRRRRALLVTCPKCGSPPSVACSGKRGARLAPHASRMADSPPPRAIAAVAVQRPRTERFYDCEAWRVVRYQALRRSRGVCECCGAGPSPGRPLHVDHVRPRSRRPDLALTLSNLQVLCADCNLGKGNTDEIDWRSPEARP
ncbi:HNH endonuclease signature motif containing protein [Methylobacterium oryzae]|uniref:HNH endonuclease n=1 Tax=Methylobacterium oryzae TaxID=334852 RepID=A0ABU7TMR5_9HYPH